MNVGSLFSGIGGFDLGLERAGMRIAWHSEIEPYACAVLRKHWPHVPNHGDIRNITAATVEPVDVLCGGFPCIDISTAGKGAGIEGEHSGLWREYARLVGELRPRFVIVENVAELLNRGLSKVLGDLAALGYDAEWHCIPASYIGAHHRRDRIWIVAYPHGESSTCLLDPRAFERGEAPSSPRPVEPRDAGCCGPLLRAKDVAEDAGTANPGAFWMDESGLDRVVDGVSCGLDRIRCIGNAIVPQIAEIIGRAIMRKVAENDEIHTIDCDMDEDCMCGVEERKSRRAILRVERGLTP